MTFSSSSLLHKLLASVAALAFVTSIGCGGSKPEPVASTAPAAATAAPASQSTGEYEPDASGASATATESEQVYDAPAGDLPGGGGSDGTGVYDPNSGGGMASDMYGMPGTMGGGPTRGLLGALGIATGARRPMGPPDPAPSEDADYLSKAQYAFAIGKEAAADQYFVAHVLANDEEAEKLLGQVRWSPGGRRPVATVRFGVAVDVKGPATIADIKPIGRPQMGGAGGGASSGMDGGMDGGMAGGSGGGPGGQGRVGKSFADLTGSFGEKLVSVFEN